jgi:hypothetical protein
MEDFVPFEIAKKLKEKGYPQDIQHCIGWYPTEYYKNSCIGEYFEGELQEIEDYFGDRISAIHITENEKKGVIAPTIPQVLKWLREKKKMHIMINFWPAGYSAEIFTEIGKDKDSFCWERYIDECYYYESYELAALAGIEYVIDNLI